MMQAHLVLLRVLHVVDEFYVLVGSGKFIGESADLFSEL